MQILIIIAEHVAIISEMPSNANQLDLSERKQISVPNNYYGR